MAPPGHKRGTIMTRKLLLCGASVVAMLVASGAANATPGKATFTASVSGEYFFVALGAAGGSILFPDGTSDRGGAGAEVFGDVFLSAGEQLTLIVGGRGGDAAFNFDSRTGFAGGGGGGSFIFAGAGTSVGNLLAAAGGGGGVALDGGAGPGLASTYGGDSVTLGPPLGPYAGLGGTNGSGGTGGQYSGSSGGGGAGVRDAGGNGAGAGNGHSGYGGHTLPTPTGGAGADGSGNGGYGGGGGGGTFFNGGGGGGGGGYSGGGGGYSPNSGYGGGGGGSFLSPLVSDGEKIGGQNQGDGSISIQTMPVPVPEPSTWAMTLAGFGGLGWLARIRRRKMAVSASTRLSASKPSD
jgi:PEP-CTERM motif